MMWKVCSRNVYDYQQAMLPWKRLATILVNTSWTPGILATGVISGHVHSNNPNFNKGFICGRVVLCWDGDGNAAGWSGWVGGTLLLSINNVFVHIL